MIAIKALGLLNSLSRALLAVALFQAPCLSETVRCQVSQSVRDVVKISTGELVCDRPSDLQPLGSHVFVSYFKKEKGSTEDVDFASYAEAQKHKEKSGPFFGGDIAYFLVLPPKKSDANAAFTAYIVGIQTGGEVPLRAMYAPVSELGEGIYVISDSFASTTCPSIIKQLRNKL